MSSSGSSPLAVVRGTMWGLLLVAGVAWLAISWTVLRLGPADIVRVAGPVILFGALVEGLRAITGMRTWWLHAGMAVLFTATGAILLRDADSSFTTPAALVGWYLMVRGAADIALSMMTRETDRIWGLLAVVGVTETGLGFFAASPFGRTGDLLITVLGALAVLRAVADLVAALRMREAPGTSLLQLPPERDAGVAGYSAGLTDYESAPARSRPRHRAASRTSTAQALGAAAAPTGPDAPVAAPAGGVAAASGGGRSGSFHDEVLRTTADLDAMLALAGVSGTAVGAVPAEQQDLPEVPDTPEGADAPAPEQAAPHQTASHQTATHQTATQQAAAQQAAAQRAAAQRAVERSHGAVDDAAGSPRGGADDAAAITHGRSAD
jgi:uncharacterized membrane protein HdeD (DUF308 family)